VENEKITKNKEKHSNLFLICMAFLLSFCFFISFNFWQSTLEETLFYYFSENDVENFALAQVKFTNQLKEKQEQRVEEMKRILDEKKLLGNSFLVIKINPENSRKIIVKKNIYDKRSIASLTKLITAVTVINNFNLDDDLKITKDAVSQERSAGSLMVDEKIKIKNLLYPLLIESSNDVAYALAESAGLDNFYKLMNSEASRIGLKNSSFSNSIGNDEDQNFSNAFDLGILVEEIINNYPEIFEISRIKEKKLFVLCKDGEDKLCFHHNMKNTNILLGKIEGVIGSKTGWSPEADGCLIMVTERGENKFINIVLGSKDRFGDMEKLIYYFNK